MSNLTSEYRLRLELERAVEEPPEIDKYEPAPVYVRFFDSLQDYTKLNRYLLYFLVALFPYFLYILLALTFGLEHSRFTDYWIRLNFSGWMFGSFLFMNYIYGKSISVYPLLTYLAHTPYNKHRIRLLYDTMFVSHRQHVVYFVIAVLTTATGVYLGLDLELAPKLFIIISSFVAGYIIGFGVWYSFGLAKLVHTIGKMKNIKINYLNPTYSIGVVEIPRLSSIWTMCFFGEALIVYIGLLLPDWSQNSDVTSTVQVFWLIIFLCLAVFNFINPITAVSRLTNEAKTRFKLAILDKLHSKLNSIEHSIDSIGQHFQEIKLIDELYERVSLAKSYVFDWAVFFRFLATSIPSLFLLFLNHYEDILRIFNLVNKR